MTWKSCSAFLSLSRAPRGCPGSCPGNKIFKGAECDGHRFSSSALDSSEPCNSAVLAVPFFCKDTWRTFARIVCAGSLNCPASSQTNAREAMTYWIISRWSLLPSSGSLLKIIPLHYSGIWLSGWTCLGNTRWGMPHAPALQMSGMTSCPS